MSFAPHTATLLVISPVKDEAEYLERTIASMVAQNRRPDLWVIVNDGSSDETGSIADHAASEHVWIKVVHRNSGSVRRVGPGVIEAFYQGLQQVDVGDYDFLCKLDGDLELAPNYFADLLERFVANSRLGTASGKCYIPVNGRWILERSGVEFSHGVAKLYRRECFEAIGGFVREVMWDGIDCHRCRMLGWEAVSYNDLELAIHHLRPMGSSYRSIYHGRVRWGKGQYFMGTHPVYLLAITLYRMLERPWIVGGLCILAGYLQAWLHRSPRYDDPLFRTHLRGWQARQLSRRLLSAFFRITGASAQDAERPNAARCQVGSSTLQMSANAKEAV